MIQQLFSMWPLFAKMNHSFSENVEFYVQIKLKFRCSS
uniref:Uncharacterized protein n=1 Tax=Loigolactobacillus rennini TaxID=238013 RepID=A0A1K2I449_9LACO|nr:hypothetical protein LREN565_0236 [Loigolactobacillus rennini]